LKKFLRNKLDNAILIGKKNMHKGAMIGMISSGGMFQIDKYIIEFVALNGQYSTVQIYQQGIDAKPIKQSWNKTKKVIEKKIVEVPKKKQETPKLITEFSDEVIEL
jgi:hypothetical protein